MSCISHKYRALVVFAGFLCLVAVCSNYVVLNFTFICMKNDFSFTRDDPNNSASLFDYSPDEKKYLMWAVAFGTILGTMPVNWLFIRYGSRWTFFSAGVISIIATAFIPVAAQTSFFALLFARFCQGIAFSADFAAIGVVTVRWAPLSETAIFLGALTMFTNFSSVFTNAVSGLICSSYGWRATFYLHAMFGTAAFFLWAIVYNDDPTMSSRVSAVELRKIQKNKSEQHLDTKNKDVPYKKILTSPVVLCIWLNAYTEMSMVVFLHTYAPLYFHKILKFNVSQTGLFLALAVFIPLPLKLVAGVVSDKAKCFSEGTKMLFFNCLSVGLVGVLVSIIGFVPETHRFLALILFTAVFACLSINVAAFYKCAALHTRQYAHVVISTIQWMKSIALISGPALVAAIVRNEQNARQWQIVFCSLGEIMIIANAISMFVFTDKPAEWTFSEREKSIRFNKTEEKLEA
ncbi:unnamed protein product [Caenorhabditis bovis]|uniref:Major facilitator superfamily (MFS) profile domain-containing protein n=1 Tax=Caenorhabditis bovis TaxID=2654633 RepID=A0A8S1EG74_9PELO|nr:unnamed protein product [Caenorhabditis bovis]